ncbi:hypothetical protein RhiirA5_505360 [Rhizophagus irregularis]|uniref:Uncharacterized protein n=3 Tax=Rhizophagus irregularis TaxID=588596 RepID=A0A2N0R1K4_9GLOM|nr:hypothetical protein GLOIN_2v1611780 [Rhizophagus irregularis DAOM 181602=DAOM 197198]EXX57928.1 hypothetical protein RirG_202570 [Rhizophagus irregularis DAOM 197198w]PKC00126.1 hypothetical protein RhiirA5_505360 [Rhizophagus irregularis]PKC57202.1 hypothetical protein RhiirA1_541728 [Rhizophagus irregularis]POG70922.1 hypothetical protein GLOIN_2v1611780 [Rhizophagus irregularis DAOM 181602=DAOM 197198]UZO06690.1 hypothetical protein OCT59_027000 [Rhizophagus irregularis]|eukprot:XP_025177788.1 hypothetical protein GLOIN_2v1611780 [Rhizophagus irregularis DAOM 181602=DAOM 197198]
MAYNYESELSEAFGQLLKIETDYNVIIYIGKEPNFKEFHAHSNVLRCRSEYFDKILSDDSIEKKDGKYIIKKQNISPQAFNVVLKYLYTGKIDIANKTKTEISNIMTVSDELLLKKLTKLIEDYPIIEKKDSAGNNIDSIIINREHLTLFANWIDRKEGNINDIPYKFNLLYRANRDGNTAEMFHAKCDNKGATLVVVKVKNSEQIVGGYTPLSWVSGMIDKSTKDSFIFSLNSTNFQNARVAYSNDNGYSISCISECGPFFGGSDLYLNHCNGPDFWCAMKPFSYPSLGLPWKIIADDYEVFQVIKK